MATPAEVISVLEHADCLYDEAAVEGVLDTMAIDIDRRLGDRNPLVISILLGGLVVFDRLLSRLSFPLEIDYLHASRYQGALTGAELQWLAGPYSDPRARTVLLIDDILDEGITLAAIEKRFIELGAAEVFKAVLVQKQRPRNIEVSIDFLGLEVPDRYVFGYGMDYRGYWRNLRGIYAVGEDG